MYVMGDNVMLQDQRIVHREQTGTRGKGQGCWFHTNITVMQEFRRIVQIYVQVLWLSYGEWVFQEKKINSPAEGKKNSRTEMKDFKLRAMLLLQSDDILS